MKKNLLPAAMAIVAICTGLLLASQFQAPTTARSIDNDTINPEDSFHSSPPLFDDAISTKAFNVAGTATHKNLTIYVLAGEGIANARTYVTLQDALKNKMVNVKETSEVNELQIDNLSSNYIYINSGDIVKGGKQDRTIQYDVIISPNERNVPLASFCVERGRWTKRGDENVQYFMASENSLSSKELKLATKQKKSQTEVWDKVHKYQDKANEELKKGNADSASVEVRSNASASSLELTLDNEHISRSKQEYQDRLLSLLKNTPNAMGFAYSINGKLYGADLFNNQKLFADMADKLLASAIAEAISEADKSKESPTVEKIQSLLEAGGKVYEDQDVNKATRFQSSDPNGFPRLIAFTTFDKELKTWLHRNWLDKNSE
jgi:hypothetical protein